MRRAQFADLFPGALAADQGIEGLPPDRLAELRAVPARGAVRLEEQHEDVRTLYERQVGIDYRGRRQDAMSQTRHLAKELDALLRVRHCDRR